VIGRKHESARRAAAAGALRVALAAALGIGLLVAVTTQAPRALAAAHDIAIVDFAFQPAELTVFVGEPVTWTNKGAGPHTVTFDDGSVDSGQILPGGSFGHVFDTPGTFKYHCAIHPSVMVATIIVKAASVTASTAAPTAAPSAAPGQDNGGGSGGIFGPVLVVVVVGGVSTYLVRAIAGPKRPDSRGPGPKGTGPKPGPKGRGSR
jgi:plastocyanin